MKCAHYACRCASAAELAEIADRSGDARYLTLAIEIHAQEVICRFSEIPTTQRSPA